MLFSSAYRDCIAAISCDTRARSLLPGMVETGLWAGWEPGGTLSLLANAQRCGSPAAVRLPHAWCTTLVGWPPRSGVWDTERHCGTELGVPTVAGEWEIGTEGAGKGFCESLCSSLLDNGLGKERDTWGHSRFHDYIQWIVNIKSRERL